MGPTCVPTQDQLLHDLDDSSTFGACWKTLLKSHTHNFAVDFDDNEARCAIDLDYNGIASLLEQSANTRAKTRWINFWGGYEQREAVGAVAASYGVSPRLMNLLCPEPPRESSRETIKIETLERCDKSESDAKHLQRQKTGCEIGYAEKAMSATEQDSRTVQSESSDREAHSLFGNVAADLWHFCSVDWGQRYLYIGYNSLFSIPGFSITAGSNKPAGLRVWTSLILCDDGTIISVFEDRDFGNRLHPEISKVVRKNTLNIFRHLSKLHVGNACKESMMTINVRNPGSNQQSSARTASDRASLLMYYLFDDWVTTYGLVTQQEHPYRKTLEGLRKQMFGKPTVDLIDSLHNTGRQLTVLKLMYQSYELIGKRILQRDRMTREHTRLLQHQRLGLHHQGSAAADEVSISDDADILTTEVTSTRVRISPAAAVRFERLVDRVQLYALNDINECLNEKESLVFMSFNLISLKEAHAVEKLTRITVLLAKATIMFLPVSLMTGYYSTQLADLQGIYTARTYWLSFLVTAVLTFLFLLAFGLPSDSVEGKVVYRSLTRILWDRRSRKDSS